MPLSEPKLQAAILVAKGRLTLAQIAQKLDIGARTLDEWKATDEFKAVVNAHLDELSDQVKKIGIADERRLLASIHSRWRRYLYVMESRQKEARREQRRIRRSNAALAEQRAQLPPPGSKDYWELAGRIPDDEPEIPLQAFSGTMARRKVSVHVGEKSYETHWEYTFDNPLADAIRECEQEALTIVGKWRTKVEHTGKGGSPIEIEHSAKVVPVKPPPNLLALGPEKLEQIGQWLKELQTPECPPPNPAT